MAKPTKSTLGPGLALLLCVAAGPAAAVADEVARGVLDGVRQARRIAGVPRLEHRGELDAVALERARRVAARPSLRRLSSRHPIGAQLREHGIVFKTAGYRLDMKSGYADPVEAFLASWRKSRTSWEEILDPERDAIGLAHLVADDGWDILVAVFLDDLPPPPDPRRIEDEVVDAVNRERVERGLEPLTVHPGLTRTARAHSEDMARRDYFAHRTPEGLRPADRARKHVGAIRLLGENLHTSRGAEDPVAMAVNGWLGSRGHRKTMLDRRFRSTGVGAAVDAGGQVYFTQLFAVLDDDR